MHSVLDQHITPSRGPNDLLWPHDWVGYEFYAAIYDVPVARIDAYINRDGALEPKVLEVN